MLWAWLTRESRVDDNSASVAPCSTRTSPRTPSQERTHSHRSSRVSCSTFQPCVLRLTDNADCASISLFAGSAFSCDTIFVPFLRYQFVYLDAKTSVVEPLAELVLGNCFQIRSA